MTKTKTFKNHILDLALWIVVLFAFFAICLVITACSAPKTPATVTTTVNETVGEKINIAGDWHNDGPDFSFEAVITEDNIEIYLLTPDGQKGLYWTGTFEYQVSEGQAIISTADTEALDASLFGSGDDEKIFSYSDETISYEFTIASTTMEIVLSR